MPAAQNMSATMPKINPRFYLPYEERHQQFKEIKPNVSTPSRLTMYEKSIKTLPQPPALWHAFKKACDEDASNKVLGNIIKDDPVLSAAILRIANAPGLGVRFAINDVTRAISHLGSSLVRSIVSQHSFSGTLSASGKVYDIHKLWKHGMAVSTLAEIIAHHIPGCSPEEASTLGLFHDIGKMSMNLFTQYQQPATLDLETGHLVFEHQRFSCTHIDLGKLLAKHWELPDNITQGIIYHHHPAYTDASDVPENIRGEVFAVYLADMMAIYLGFDTGDSGISQPHNSYLDMLPNITLLDILHSDKVQTEIKRIEQVDF